ncbi:DUF1289 domain-containing protein [Rubellimicrobium roseum]|uniref:DUF1289 domain-containing protein n=1 Tax=Rubellimicrobium roseum TaxID=687525 RepID=A0A5C4N4S1_9RHOB|nr:DUF1289 domain-containing protein [Rubellimicrobium roseum]TNC63223.1 DUF1289 domain-containing protein [Rubellimicrobium roseum]
MDDVWARDEPESPCRKVCLIHPDNGLCVGCLRTRQEIAAWPSLSSEARRAVMAQLPARGEANAPRRRGGRAGRILSEAS